MQARNSVDCKEHLDVTGLCAVGAAGPWGRCARGGVGINAREGLTVGEGEVQRAADAARGGFTGFWCW